MASRAATFVALLTLAGCGTSLEAQLDDAAARKGVADAKVQIPDLPEDCRKREPHAALTEGAEAVSILKRERLAVDRGNARIDRCAAFHDEMKANLEDKPAGST